MAKKKIVFHSNYSRAFTGFGKNAKNVLKYLYETDKYEIIEFANGFGWNHPQFQKEAWRAYGSLPEDPQLMQELQKDPHKARMAGYGANMVDQIIKEEKPDIYIGAEDIWAFNGYTKKKWWNKINCMVWTTLDSLPILPDAVDVAPDIKNYYVWATFAEKALHKMGHKHVKTLHGSLDTKNFYRLEDEQRRGLRIKYNLPTDAFIIGYVFRNQLRKSVPNLLDGFKLFLRQEPQSKAYLLLHTHWGEGWDIPRLIKEKDIDNSRILTTYVCDKCREYHIKPFTAQKQNCPFCGAKESQNTTGVSNGVSEFQLNEVYNFMDVYCHPFTSGGQEIPVQEAKLTELITLVTNYSCGEDSCSKKSGGVPLDWTEYREPGTQFIKATTYPSSIQKQLRKVYKMSPDKRASQGKLSREYVLNTYSASVIGKKLEKILDEMPSIDWDYNFDFELRDPSYTPPDISDNSEWISHIYKNILKADVDENDEGHKHWMHRLSSDLNREAVLNYFRQVAVQENAQSQQNDFADLFDKTENKKALMILKGESSNVFNSTSLLKSFKNFYPDYDLYYACDPKYHFLLDGNPYIHKTLPYLPLMEEELAMVGRGPHNGYVDLYINLGSCFRAGLNFLTNENKAFSEHCHEHS